MPFAPVLRAARLLPAEPALRDVLDPGALVDAGVLRPLGPER